jgi:hypothetical protein
MPLRGAHLIEECARVVKKAEVSTVDLEQLLRRRHGVEGLPSHLGIRIHHLVFGQSRTAKPAWNSTSAYRSATIVIVAENPWAMITTGAGRVLFSRM